MSALQSYLVESLDFVNSRPRYPNYAEEGQDFPLKFQSCFPDKTRSTYKIIHGPVICRDFLGDVACSLFFKNSSSIYGFEANVVPELSGGWRTELSFLLKFPSPDNRRFFETNLSTVLSGFNLSIPMRLVSSLNTEEDELIINLGQNVSPVGLSLLTWLFKIAARDLQSNSECMLALYARTPSKFLELYAQAFPGKEARYIERIDPFVFDALVPSIFDYSASACGFTYLEKFRNNISFLHNNSGFFSQFNKSLYSSDESLLCRRLFGTVLDKMGQKAPFKFSPLTNEELLKLVPPGYGFSILGNFFIISESGDFVPHRFNKIKSGASSFSWENVTLTAEGPQPLTEAIIEDHEDEEEDEGI